MFDLEQALSRRIHYGRFVAEVKFRDAPDDYIPLIKSKVVDCGLRSIFRTVPPFLLTNVDIFLFCRIGLG